MEREGAFNLNEGREGPGPLALPRSSIAICDLLTSVSMYVCIFLQRALRKFGCPAAAGRVRVPVTARQTDGPVAVLLRSTDVIVDAFLSDRARRVTPPKGE